MSTHEFTFKGQTIAFVEADTRREATAYLKGAIESRELSSREIIALGSDDIIDSKTGTVIGGENAEQCPPLVVSDHGG
jgi:hypothetical protein